MNRILIHEFYDNLLKFFLFKHFLYIASMSGMLTRFQCFIAILFLVLIISACNKEVLPPEELCDLPPNALRDGFGFDVVYSGGLSPLQLYGAEAIMLLDRNGQAVPSFQIGAAGYSFVPLTFSDTISELDTVANHYFLKYGDNDVDTIEYAFRLKYGPDCDNIDVYTYSYTRIIFNDSLYYEGVPQDGVPPLDVIFVK